MIPTIREMGESYFHPGSQVGCVLVHGLTSTPQEVRELGAFLAQSGYSVLAIRLPGHATSHRDLHRAHWRDWLARVEDGVHLAQAICDRVYLVGLSLGGALSLTYGAYQPIQGVISMSTPYFLPHPSLRFLDPLAVLLRWLSPFVRALPKFQPLDYQNPAATDKHLGYRVYPTRALYEAALLLREMRKTLPDIRCPCLILHSKQDRGVLPRNAELLHRHIGSHTKELHWIENSGHVLTMDRAKEKVFDSVCEFIHRMEGQVEPANRLSKGDA